MKDETTIVTAGRAPEENLGVVNPPVYHTSTILHPTLADLRQSRQMRDRDEPVVLYGRVGHPTSLAFEAAVAALEGGYRTLAYPSGLAAISTALLAFLRQGDHVLISDSVYGPTRNFANNILSRFGVESTYYNPTLGGDIRGLMQANTRVVYTEAPGSQTFEMQDIPAIVEVAHAAGAVVMIDNTWASPLFFKPIEMGVDLSIQAATKYLVGHSDAMLGTVTTTQEHFKALRTTTIQLGQCAGPDDVYLGQRGLRTLSVRLNQHWKNALQIAEWLQTQPEVRRVLYPPLATDPGHALWKRDFSGGSGLMGLLIDPCSETALAAMLDGLAYFGMGASWGGYESLILPMDPNQFRSAAPFAEDGQLLRLHIGLEHPQDLIDDLAAGFERLRAAG